MQLMIILCMYKRIRKLHTWSYKEPRSSICLWQITIITVYNLPEHRTRSELIQAMHTVIILVRAAQITGLPWWACGFDENTGQGLKLLPIRETCTYMYMECEHASVCVLHGQPPSYLRRYLLYARTLVQRSRARSRVTIETKLGVVRSASTGRGLERQEERKKGYW